ncbi:OmpP1/FadL family transporter [Thiomicrorhabdus lithotrophica]|uniref:Outer membrane protein transport protein n=1 Tax=Thiomicrorhabdus lithotrophica TaxID=2949997 RepID=A0ABY8C8B0_9GAMM|nr:outer membrane protein transport protein [Thiomicrorhabdus lithotrophica]WEJ62201.1 outer membrane protein transport protein [Thiomicrorhabdus lithotrophica]
MKKTKLALAIATAAMVSTSTPVLATNGDVLIGLGAQARALGGTGTAAFFGSENALTNPALLGKSQGSEFAIGGTAFMPNVEATSDVSAPGSASSEKSGNDMNVIPEVSMSTRINENWTFGLGMFGSAGMGVDYRDNAALFEGYSNLQLMKFAPSIAYNDDNFGLGFAPVIQYGALDISYEQNSNPEKTGNGMSTDLGYGFNLGGYMDINDKLTIGLAYQSAISMEYKDQISVAATGFGLTMADKLEQPAEIKIGAAYNTGNWMVTADAKQIKWGDAAGYKEFNWEDQNVFALGAKYTANDYWLGAGYNFGSDPIKEVGVGSTGATPGAGGMDGYYAQASDLFNNHFFPGVVESHITFGGGYSLGKNTMIEGAVTYAAEVEKTVDTGVISSALGSSFASTADAGTSHTVKHSQLGYTVSLKMNF